MLNGNWPGYKTVKKVNQTTTIRVVYYFQVIELFRSIFNQISTPLHSKSLTISFIDDF